MTATPFYLDWQFWAFVIAAVALVFSQLEPLHVLLRRGKLSCETIDQIFVNHNVGSPTCQWHVFIENTGGKTIRVNSISLTFAKLGGNSFVLPVRSYLEVPNSRDAVMFTPFRLKAGETWAHVINSFVPLNRDDDKFLRELQSNLRADIFSQKELPENKDKLCEATDKEAVAALVLFMQRHFRWTHGEYTAELKIKTSSGDDLEQTYAFTLFESDSKALRDHADRYRYGDGLWFASQAVQGQLIPVRKQ